MPGRAAESNGSVLGALLRGALLVVTAVMPSLAIGQAAEQSLRLPSHFPINPLAVSRSGLFVPAFSDPAPGWMPALSVDYASAIEWEEVDGGGLYVLDAELMRVQLTLTRDVAPGRFVVLDASVNGVFNGFADAAFDWYHGLVGVSMRGRELRPHNKYRYSFSSLGELSAEYERPDHYLGDVRVSYGARHSTAQQTLLSATLPTSTAGDGFSRGTFSLSLLHSYSSSSSRRLRFQASAGVGYTPTHGRLSSVQNELFVSGSAGLLLRALRTHSIYGYLFAHSPYYKGSGISELDRRELTADIGWMARTANGRVWRLGITEDFGPFDQGVDLVLRVGLTW